MFLGSLCYMTYMLTYGNTCCASKYPLLNLILILLLSVEIPNHSLMIYLTVQRRGGVLDAIHLIPLRRMNVVLFCRGYLEIIYHRT